VKNQEIFTITIKKTPNIIYFCSKNGEKSRNIYKITTQTTSFILILIPLPLHDVDLACG